ncbi:hypothetical protein [Hamadaea tsunoensis]|uniref:hypothetical protein n=1 Tax=Hamadaea tsunoensis TaxID=53368 RepID=UPI0004241D13|nr:hypothetical protein [Hamadaea tsunoensis]
MEQWPWIRVRCLGAAWHEVRIGDGRLLTPRHSDAEIEREHVLRGLGGPLLPGCAETVWRWRTADGRLPKHLKLQRNAFFRLADEGRTGEVLRQLDAGFDVAAAGPGGSTLLHYLGTLDVDAVLPRLLAAGLGVHRRNKQGEAPLHRAALAVSLPAVAALLAAGADPLVRDLSGRRPGERWAGKTDERLPQAMLEMLRL